MDSSTRYFFFMEDVDLCYREQLEPDGGVRVASDSVVYHRGQAAVNRGHVEPSLMGDKFHAHSTGVFLGAHGEGYRPDLFLRLMIMVLNRVRRRQVGRIAPLAADLVRGWREARHGSPMFARPTTVGDSRRR